MAIRAIHLIGVAALLCATLTVSGCGKKPQNFIPSSQLTEEAVRRGLEAWKAGRPPGELPGSPAVHVTDAGRKPGQTLESYQILGETQGATGRTIAVKLRLANPSEEVRARYVVVGIDPLWVFRQEDYELLMHWDHHMPAEKPADPAASAPDAPADALDALEVIEVDRRTGLLSRPDWLMTPVVVFQEAEDRSAGVCSSVPQPAGV